MKKTDHKTDYYKILDLPRDCCFKEIKQAYYRRAKECHPDLFGNSLSKTEEFKQVVIAFDVLSDPEKRRRYDLLFIPEEEQEIAEAVAAQESIMDTLADDDLEELIVGNTCPEQTTLATLFLDLQKTEVFITFREGKNLFHEKRFKGARSYLQNAVSLSPYNILYRVFLARDLAILREYKLAKMHYRTALDIGSRRDPPQNLYRIKKELSMVSQQHRPFWSMFMGLLRTGEHEIIQDSDQKMIEQTSRELTRLARKHYRERKKRQELSE